MEFTGGGLSKVEVEALADLLANEISRMGNVRVIGKSDILQMLKLEQQKRLVGCDTTDCISEVAGALGARWMVAGNIIKFEETYLLNLKLFDVERMEAISRVSRQVKGGKAMLLSAMTGAVHELFSRVAEKLGLVMAETVILASRHPQPLKQSPSAVTVISREDIEASGASTIPDLLRLVPGMDVVVVTPSFTAIEARLNWNYENNVYLVLIDGREANNDMLGQPFWEIQPILLDDIQRIEIIRGPGSALFGANAFAGVISITTRSMPEKTSIWAGVTGGEVGVVDGAGRVSTRIGDLGLSLSAGIDQTGAFFDPRRSGSEFWKVRSVAEYRLSESSRIMLDGGLASGSGTVSTGAGTIRGNFDLRTVRLAYDSEDLRGQIYWTQFPVDALMDTPLVWNNIKLAEIKRADIDMHTVDGQVQWTVPRFYEPLMIIVGAAGRFNRMSSGQLLDADTFSDWSSVDFHKEGIEYWELRAGAFVHGEWTPADWVAVTGGLRFDYNTETGKFWSPRIAAVFRPASGQFLRIGVARAFRKPAIMETRVHPSVDIPDSSPFAHNPGAFNEFMTRVIGNSELENEELISFEVGYLGQFLDGGLSVSLDLFYTRLMNPIDMAPEISPDIISGLSDSSFQYQNLEHYNDIFGGELAIRYRPVKWISLLAAWSHKEVYRHDISRFSDTTPKNLITLGGRFWTEWGLIGSLYAFSRSEFWDHSTQNPEGILEGYSSQHMANVFLLQARLGYKLSLPNSLEFEGGVKLFLPVSPFEAPQFRYRECGGGMTPDSTHYGCHELRRVISVYLQGSF